MVAVHDIGPRAEQQECACPICAFGLALGEALVVREGAIFEITEYIARRNETRKDRFLQANEGRQCTKWIKLKVSMRDHARRLVHRTRLANYL
jgi:hypothetical protein